MSTNHEEEFKAAAASLSPTALQLEEVQEENRYLHQRIGEMEAAIQQLLRQSAPPTVPEPERTLTTPAPPPAPEHTPATPASRLSVPRVPAVGLHQPTASVVRSLTFRLPPPAPTAPSTPAPSLNTAEVPPSLPSLLRPRSHVVKVDHPDKFGGSKEDRAYIYPWLDEVVGWMNLSAPGESDEVYVAMFRSVLKKPASVWYRNFTTRTVSQGKPLTIQAVFNAFVRTYQGGLSQKMAEQKLNSLVYGKGECKDLTATDNEFDRLAQELYPGAEDSDVAISLLANIYSNVIRHGDEELWEKAMDAQPSTLDEWKAAVQNAYVVLETKKAHRLSKARVDRQEVRTTYFSKSSPSTSSSYSPAVQVKKAAVEEDHHDTTREEGEEEVQKAEVSSTSRPPFRSTHEKMGSHLSYTQRQRLSDLNKCWICLKAGHRSFFCENKGKPGYPLIPTAEQLKA